MAILSRHITAASPPSLAVALAATRLSSGKLGPVRVPLARAARGTLAAERELTFLPEIVPLLVRESLQVKLLERTLSDEEKPTHSGSDHCEVASCRRRARERVEGSRDLPAA